MSRDLQDLEKLPTGVGGLDTISHGGLPKGRMTLVTGSAGSGKTVLGLQFLAAGAAMGEAGVFVTFEEHPADIRANGHSLGWDIAAHEAAGLWAFVDASPELAVESVEVGEYDLDALIIRVRHAVQRTGATRLAIDSVSTLFTQFADRTAVRRELLRLISALRELGVTAILTAERVGEESSLGRFGVEEFVADNVVILRNTLEDGQRRRTIEILKLRGTSHQRGEYAFTIVRSDGFVVLPLSGVALQAPSSLERISCGIPELDDLCSGGFYRDAIVLVSGATGTGKTLTATHFAAGAAEAGERCLVFALEESRDQLVRNASGWGIDFVEMESRGLLHISSIYPEAAGLEDHLLHFKQTIEAYNPARVAVDSLSALERSASVKSFREFVMGLSTYLKQRGIGGLFTSTTPGLLGGNSITDAHISTITDSVILLRYVETGGEVRRGLTVLKMRGSMHDRTIREFTIGPGGMRIGNPFRGVTGILSGAMEVSTELMWSPPGGPDHAPG